MCYSLSHVGLFANQWTVAHQAPLSTVILQARVLEWVTTPSSRGPSWHRDRTQVSCIAGRFFTNFIHICIYTHIYTYIIYNIILHYYIINMLYINCCNLHLKYLTNLFINYTLIKLRTKLPLFKSNIDSI